jgi:hypothetical protein
MPNHKSRVLLLTQRHFDFLVTENGFVFDEDSGAYLSEDIDIYISADLLEPIVAIRVKSEPDYTRMNLKWYIFYIMQDDVLQSIRLKNTLEENFAYFAQILKQNIYTIINGKAELLLHVLKLFVERSAAYLRWPLDQLTSEFESYRLLYDYMKQKDPDWKP